jgi:hypothetical protein
MEKGLEIDFETADRITLSSLKDHRKYLSKELEDYFKKDRWLHTDDVIRNAELIKAIELIIAYYGGTND